MAADKPCPQLHPSLPKSTYYISQTQVAWPTKTYHTTDEAQELLSRPRKRVKKQTFPAPILDQDDSEKTIILFPGQGCQYVGMGQKTIEKAPATKLLFDEASSILGYDLLKLCLNGPKDLLDRTEHCQIAIVIASLGIIFEISTYILTNR